MNQIVDLVTRRWWVRIVRCRACGCDVAASGRHVCDPGLLVRDVLAAEAAGIHPSPDALDHIRARAGVAPNITAGDH